MQQEGAMTTGEISSLPDQTRKFALPVHCGPIDEAILADLIKSIGVDATEAQIEIFDLFFENTPAIVDHISREAKSSAWNQVRADLHALIGSCELFGAIRLTQTCKQLGKMLASGDQSQAPALVQEIQLEYQQVVEALRLKRPAGAGLSENNQERVYPKQERIPGFAS
jgi:HPt (histidine-containing phosphotransfer) domain-containing protein